MIRKRTFALSVLAILAGCSSPAPPESVANSAAAVTTSMAFHQIPGTTGADVGSGSQGLNWVAKSASNGQEYSWGFGTPPAGALVGNQSGVAIDLGAQGPWVITAANQIYGWVNGTYGLIPGSATDVGVSPDGNTVYVVGSPSNGTGPTGYHIFKFVNNSWYELPGQYGTRVDAANDGSAYVVDNKNVVWHIAGTPANPVTTPFGPTGTNATDVTVAADGTVFVVGNNGAGNDAPIYVYDPAQNSWDPLPGPTGMRISASSATVVSVAASNGTVWTTGSLTGPSAWAASLLPIRNYPNTQLWAGAEIPIMESSGDTGEVWHEANIVEMLVDYQAKTGNSAYQGFVEAYDSSNYDPIHPFLAIENPYNDDDLWWALADIRAADVLHDPSWLTPAQNVFQHVCAQWAAVPTCGGGLPWAMAGTTGDHYLNTITNELFFQAAIALYKEFPNATNVCSGQQPWTNDSNTVATAYGHGGPGGLSHYFANDYLGWALAEYEWFKQYYLAPSMNPPFQDGIQLGNGSTACDTSGPAWTYNQGPILGGLLGLSQVPASALTSHFEGDSPATILGYGFNIATAAMTTFVQPGATSSNSILTELNDLGPISPQIPIANSGNGDNVEFKGVFERYLGRFVSSAAPTWGPYSNWSFQFTPFATAFLNRNAASIWANSANGTVAPVVWSRSGIQASQWSGWPDSTSAEDGLIAAISINGPAQPSPPPPPGPPNCIFPFNHQPPNEGQVLPTCTPDAANDPIFIFELTPSNTWQYVYQYFPFGTGIPPVPVGGQATFLGCSYNALYSTGSVFGSVNDTYPGAPGCDLVAQTDVYPACVPSFSCETNVTCGVNSDGCGNTLNCGACAAGSTCASNGWCQTPCNTAECRCANANGVWNGTKCVTNCDGACACGIAGGSWIGGVCI